VSWLVKFWEWLIYEEGIGRRRFAVRHAQAAQTGQHQAHSNR